jgi:(S)-2-hydroxyglutarate dehydrogenase
MSPKVFNYLIVGGGIVGLTIARELNVQYPKSSIVILEKEADISQHSSGRNSGVLHAGFYYTADSLKAKFTVAGNSAMKTYCKDNGLKINECGKVVVAKNEAELRGIDTLYERGVKNGVDLTVIDKLVLRDIEPNARTFDKALYSPSTATVDPVEISQCLKKELLNKGITFRLNEGYLKRRRGNIVVTTKGNTVTADVIINCAGLYADKVAQDYGFSNAYTILPFKGIYLKYSDIDLPVRTNIYPVPNIQNPFLGVHYTVTVDNHIKIGPTAIPAFWRENYSGFDNFALNEFVSISMIEASLLLKNNFNFRSLAFEEIKKYWKPYYRKLATDLVHQIDGSKFKDWTNPGIRAQLMDKSSKELVQDFVIEGDENSVHILNAVSPAFTCSIPFAEHVVSNYIIK